MDRQSQPLSVVAPPDGLIEIPLEEFQESWQLHRCRMRLWQLSYHLQRRKSLTLFWNTLLDSAIEFSGAERAFLLTKWREKWHHLAQRNMDLETLTPSQVKLSPEVVEEVWNSGHFFLSENAQEDPRLADLPSTQKWRLRSILCLPLSSRQQVLGLLYLDNRLSTNVFSLHHTSLLQPFLCLGASVLDNLFLYWEHCGDDETLRPFSQGADLPGE